METVESAEKTAMGIAETGDKKRSGKVDSILWRPLLLGGDKNVCQQSNLQRGVRKGRACKLS